ncbi:tyrosine-type recombinase/integrase [Mesobacillus zeae]|uniref:tyrosine-type recombinase/integrase n=1 Tax=Mesobacillus zeae TaxID=1917180 RepID=UPI0030093239
MPYGFIKHLKNKGYSEATINSYEKVLNQFFAYIRENYPLNKEPFQISPTDIKNYLEEQREKEKTLGTVNKELAILKTLFNYLWEIDKVPLDPAAKIKRYNVKELPKVEVDYKDILVILEKVLSNPDYSKIRKAIFLLAVKGLKTSDFRFRKQDVIDSLEDGLVIINLHNRNIVLESEASTWFFDYYYESLFNNSEYVFTTKPHGSEEGPIQVMSILNHLRAISQDYLPKDKSPLTLVSIRRSIAYDLYSNNTSLQDIAKVLGIEESSASNYLKQITEGFPIENST